MIQLLNEVYENIFACKLVSNKNKITYFSCKNWKKKITMKLNQAKNIATYQLYYI